MILNRANRGPIHEAFLEPSTQCPLGSFSLCCLFSHRPPWAVTRGGPAWLARQHRSCEASAQPERCPGSGRTARDRRGAATPGTRGPLPHATTFKPNCTVTVIVACPREQTAADSAPPLTSDSACPSVSLHPVGACSLRPSRELFSLLEGPLSVILLSSYSSFKSQLRPPLLCATCLPLSSHRSLFRLAAACPCPAPQNPSRLLKLFHLPGLSSRPGSDTLWASGVCRSPPVFGAGSGKSQPAPRRTRSRRLWRRETSPQGSRHRRLLACTAPARAPAASRLGVSTSGMRFLAKEADPRPKRAGWAGPRDRGRAGRGRDMGGARVTYLTRALGLKLPQQGGGAPHS